MGGLEGAGEEALIWGWTAEAHAASGLLPEMGQERPQMVRAVFQYQPAFRGI